MCRPEHGITTSTCQPRTASPAFTPTAQGQVHNLNGSIKQSRKAAELTSSGGRETPTLVTARPSIPHLKLSPVCAHWLLSAHQSCPSTPQRQELSCPEIWHYRDKQAVGTGHWYFPKLIIIYFMCMTLFHYLKSYFELCVRGCYVHVWMQVPTESRRKCQIPWSWSYKQLWATNTGAGNWKWVPCKTSMCSQSEPLSSTAPLFFWKNRCKEGLERQLTG